MTFLELGQAVFVRNPQPELAEFFAEQYDEHAQLPADAANTGYERDGEHLCLSSDKQRAFVGTVDYVEILPRTIRPSDAHDSHTCGGRST